MRGDKDENLNVRSAFLHVLGDLLGSVGAIVAALLILFFGWNLADPIASVFVALLITIAGFRVIKDAVHILMEGVPPQIDVAEVKESLLALNGVRHVHDLHVWSITSDFPALSCHLVMEPTFSQQDLLVKAKKRLLDFHITHTTIQIETDKCQGDTCN